MSGTFVNGFVCGKNDATDVRSLYMATQQPEFRSVAVKTEGQQADRDALIVVRQGQIPQQYRQARPLRH